MPRFKDYPDFTPNLTPRQMFKLGSFGGTYWRPIRSAVTGKTYRNQHREFPASWWKDIPDKNLTSKGCDLGINKYKAHSGTSLDFWEEKDWISEHDPYGWVQWYCRFIRGRRIPEEDTRQIQRWKNFAGPNGRFRRRLINMCKNKKKSFNDSSVSPKIRQGLQHWGYQLTQKDFNNN